MSLYAQHFPPRFIKSANDEWSGYNVELFKTLMAKIGCTPRYIEVSWGRGLQLLASGELDVISNMSINEQRSDFAHFIGPHQHEEMQLITNQPVNVTNMTDLIAADGLIAIMEGTYYGPDFENEVLNNYLFRKRLVFVGTTRQKIDLFKLGRVQYAFEDSINLQQFFTTHELNPDQHHLLFTLYQTPVYFAFSKKSIDDKTIKSLLQAWTQLEEEGIVEQLKKRYSIP